MGRIGKVVAILLVLNLLDVWTTWQGMTGRGDFIELNPTWLGHLVREGHWFLLIGLKIGLVGLMGGVLILLQRRESRLFSFAWQTPVAVFTMVVLWNATQLILERGVYGG